MTSQEKPWLCIEINAGAWLIDRFATEEEAEARAEELRRATRSIGDGREYKVKEME